MPTITQNDNLDEFEWDTITTRTDASGNVIEIQTVYDDATFVVETFHPDGRKTVQTYDNGNLHPWTSQGYGYDADGMLIGTGSVVYDDGTTLTETFQDGLRKSSVETDSLGGDGIHVWSEIYTTYDTAARVEFELEFDVLQTRETYFDSGIVRIEHFTFNQVTTLLDSDQSEDGLAASWQSQRSVYDPNTRALLSQFTEYDDGTTELREYTAEIQVDVTKTDPENTQDWDTITEKYLANGEYLEKREVIYDNGVRERIIGYGFDGLSYWQTQIDEADVFNWTTIVRKFTVNGADLISTVFDSGLERFDGFIDGQLQSSTFADAADKYGWEKYTDGFDDGVRTLRIMTYDDGLERRSVFDQSGALVSQTDTDAADTRNWVTFEKLYAPELGEALRTIKTLDNGTVITTSTFVDGTVSKTEDDAANNQTWATIVTATDPNVGTVTKRVLQDNGDVTQTSSINGQKISVLQQDISDSKSWSERTTFYDATGQIANQTTLFDNGRTREDRYDSGKLTIREEQDTADKFVWTDIAQRFHVDGARESRLIRYDNGDRVATIYETESGRLNVSYDGDGDKAWLLRASDDAGTKSYDDLEEVPQDYLIALDLIL